MTSGTSLTRRCFARIATLGHWRQSGNTPWILNGYNVVRLCKIGALLWLLGCAHAPESPLSWEQARASAHYTVTIFDNFRGARVRLCLEGAKVDHLVPIGASAPGELRGAWIGGEPLDTAQGRIQLLQPARSSCIDYETRFRTPAFRTPNSAGVIVSQTQWLWRPDPFPPELEASVRFVLPADGQVSLPWPRSDDTYFPNESAFFAGAYAVFGSFDRQVFSVADIKVDVVRLGPRPPDDDIRRWLGRAVQATASVGQRFPRDTLHFIIVPGPSQGKPVVFGMVRRGGGSSILLVPSPDATAEQLDADWVAIHELSHLWLPNLYPRDRWLSEGLATYLQEVLRARCGLQSGERAWGRLREGFERGRRSGTGRHLANESRDMNRTGAYHRVYWAGAAFALETDVRLRQNSGGEMTLLRAIGAAQPIWGSEARPVASSVLLDALQEVSGAGFIEELGDKYAASAEFPGNTYLDSPRYRDIRTQITAGASDACEVSVESFR